jgi:hypothetical protein
VITRASLIRRYKAISLYLLETWSKLRQYDVDMAGVTGSIPVVTHAAIKEVAAHLFGVLFVRLTKAAPNIEHLLRIALAEIGRLEEQLRQPN